MDLSIGSSTPYNLTPGMVSSTVSADDLETKLKSGTSTDKELMDVCKSFESYMLEQVYKNMKKTVPQDEDQGPYVEQFGDMLYEQYAKDTTENQSIGIAQMLYDSMKRNGVQSGTATDIKA